MSGLLGAADSYLFNATAGTGKVAAAWRRVQDLATQKAKLAASAKSSKDGKHATPSASDIRAQVPLSGSFHAPHPSGSQSVPSAANGCRGALLWFPAHHADFVSWVQDQHIPDLFNSTAVQAPDTTQRVLPASKCVPGLASNSAVMRDEAPQRRVG